MQQGLTQKQFCKKNLLKTPATLSSIEKGRSFPTVDTIVSICKNSNVSADSLLFGSAIKNLKDGTDKLKTIKRVVTGTIMDHNRLLKGEEMRLQTEIAKFMDKRDALLGSLEAQKAGRLKLEPGQAEIIEHDLKFDIDFLAFLETQLHIAQKDTKTFEQDAQVLRDFFLSPD
jgi:transcriptional regulator with XRE-family HTH domain